METTSLKVNDRVRSKNNHTTTYKVLKIETVQMLTVEAEDAFKTTYTREASLFDPVLSPEQAWMEVPVRILELIQETTLPLWSYEVINIKEKVAKMLRDSGVAVDEATEERLTQLITRVEKQVKKIEENA